MKTTYLTKCGTGFIRSEMDDIDTVGEVDIVKILPTPEALREHADLTGDQ